MKKALKLLLLRIQSVNLLDTIGFVFNFLIVFSLAALPLYYSQIVELDVCLTCITSLQTHHWRIIVVGALFIVVITYIREMIITRDKEKKLQNKKIMYDLVEGAIESLTHCNHRSKIEKKECVNSILRFIEKTVVQILRDLGTNFDDKICANIMVKKPNPERLALEFFGTMWGGREKRELALDENDIQPGAPEAFYTNKVMYVDDTTRRKYKKFFNTEKSYRSIISIPICENGDEVIAILNIDSDVAYIFRGRDIINKQILPVLQPFLSILKLMKQTLKYS